MKNSLRLISLTLFALLILSVFVFIPELRAREKLFDDDNSKYTNVGNIAITVTNFGVFGNGFKLWPTQPSFQYPRGSGIEHLFIGGLWVGAMTANGARVTSGAVDISAVKAGQMVGFEFTTGKNSKVVEKSTLPDSRFYDPNAISHQDFIADFTDTNITNPNENNEVILDHSPLGINVHLETYAFNYSFADNFVIFNYWIKNVSSKSLDSVYVGLYGDLVVRNTNLTPPTVGSPFYNKGGQGYVDTLNLAYAYDFNGDGGNADSYGGFKFLGSTPYNSTTGYQSWKFSNTSDPLLFFPNSDALKFSKMATGLLPAQIKYSLIKPSNNMTMLTVGPFSHIPVGDSINVVFSLLAAKMKTWGPPDPDDLTIYPHNRDNLYQTCAWAQRTYNGEDRNGNGIQDADEVWTNHDATGHAVPKRYFLPTSTDTTSVTSSGKESGLTPSSFTLYQNYPNPYNPSTTIQYGLPARSTVRLVIYNVLGQVVKELVNTEQPAGYQSVMWNANVSSGLYFYRLEATSKDEPSKRFVETKKMLLMK